MPGMGSTRLLYTEYYLTFRRARKYEWQIVVISTSKLNYIKHSIKEWESSHNICRQYEVKLKIFRIGYTRLTHRHVVSRHKGVLTMDKLQRKI